MNTVCIVICEYVKVKVMYDVLFKEAVLLFVDGFIKCFDEETEYTINLYMGDNETISKSDNMLMRCWQNSRVEVFLYNSMATYHKTRKISDIYISVVDMVASSGKYNYNIVYFLLTEVLTRILLECGFCAYHASSISLNGKAIVFMGESMSGKTTLSLKLLSKGYHYLGDDRIFIKNGQVYSYPKPLHISHDVRSFFEDGYLKTNKRGKSFVAFSKYIKPQCVSEKAELSSIFMIKNNVEEMETTFVKKERGTIYGLNSLFYCNEELSQLLDSIIEIDEIPVYIFHNQYCDAQVKEIDLMIKRIIS